MKYLLIFSLLLSLTHQAWSQKITPMGEGLKGQGIVYAIDANSSNSDVLIGGDFDAAEGIIANNVAIRDSLTWNNMNGGVNGPVYDVICKNNFSYVAGNFTEAGGKPIKNIAKWNGQNWSALCSIPPNNVVLEIEYFNSALYAIGYFTEINGVSANYIAKYENNQWSNIGTGFDGPPNHMIVCGGKLYISGYIYNFNGDTAKYVAWIDSNGTTGTLNSVFSSVSLSFKTIFNCKDTLGIVGSHALYKYDGATINPITNTWPDIKNAFTYKNKIFVVYDTTKQAPGTDIHLCKIRKLENDSTLGHQLFESNDASTINIGFNPEINTIKVKGHTLYIGGNFRNVNKNIFPTAVEYDGTQMVSLAKCAKAYISSYQYALALCSYRDTVTPGNPLYVGGDFLFADNQLSPFIAVWNGNSWTCPGGGFDAPVRAITSYGGAVYTGGNFEKSGNTILNHIAKLQGNTWAPVSNGTNGTVRFMINLNGNLYLAGEFSKAGGIYSPYVIKYNGTSFQYFSSNNLTTTPFSIISYRDTLYIGNQYGLYRKNSSSWNTVWQNGPVYFMTVFKDTLIFGIDEALCYKYNNTYTLSNPLQTGVWSYYKPMMIGEDLFAYNNHAGLTYYANGSWDYINFSNLNPYFSSRIDSTHIMIGGFIPGISTYNGIIYLNNAVILEYQAPSANLSRNLDSICAYKYAIYFSEYLDLSSKIVWNFPGGTPNFSIHQNPYVQYTTAGTYGASCTMTNLAGTATYFLPDSITVYPCIIGIDDPIQKSKTISVYPNPNSGTFILNNPHSESFDISILDVLGKTIYKTTIQGISSMSIDENKLEPGIYFIACQNATSSQTIKMIRQ